MKKRYLLALAILLILGVCFFIFQVNHSSTIDAVQASGKYGNAPRLANGMIDYLAVSNQIRGQDVTVDNNVVVDIVQAYGANQDSVPPEVFEQFTELLGYPDLDDEGFYDAPIEFAKNNEELNIDTEVFSQEVNDALEGPWNETEYPDLAKWLEASDSALDRFVEASHKPKYFHPLCQKDGVVIGALLPYAQNMREVANSISLRALNRLHLGDVAGCLSDLAAIRRLGKKMEQASTLVEHLIGYAILEIAFDAEGHVLVQIANGADLSDQEISDYRQVIQATSRFQSLSSAISQGELFYIRDIIQRLERGDLSALEVMEQSGFEIPMLPLFSKLTNWEATLGKCEAFFEKLSNAVAIEDHAERRLALAQLEQNLEAEEAKTSRPSFLFLRAMGSASSRGEMVGDILVSMLSPAVVAVDDARVRAMGRDMSDIGFAIELFRRANGTFPDKLDQLVPEYLQSVPVDRFDGNPLRFRSKEDGYRLWNVGRNRLDDQIAPNGNLIDTGLSVDDSVIDIRLGDNKRNDSE